GRDAVGAVRAFGKRMPVLKCNEQSFVSVEIFTCHFSHCESGLEAAAHRQPVQAANLPGRAHCIFNRLDEKARYTLVYDFRDRSAAPGDHWRSGSVPEIIDEGVTGFLVE